MHPDPIGTALCALSAPRLPLDCMVYLLGFGSKNAKYKIPENGVPCLCRRVFHGAARDVSHATRGFGRSRL